MEQSSELFVDEFGDQFYHFDESCAILHRPEGPAYIGQNGSQAWWVGGNLHRTDGPAVSRSDGIKLWFVNDKQYRDNKSFQEAAGITDEEMSFIIIKYGGVK